MIAVDHILVKYMNVVCSHRNIKVYPTSPAKVKTVCGNVNYEVEVVKNLMHSVILGHDFPLLGQLWGKRGSSNRSKKTPGVDGSPLVNDTDGGVLTDINDDPDNFSFAGPRAILKQF